MHEWTQRSARYIQCWRRQLLDWSRLMGYQRSYLHMVGSHLQPERKRYWVEPDWVQPYWLTPRRHRMPAILEGPWAEQQQHGFRYTTRNLQLTELAILHSQQRHPHWSPPTVHLHHVQPPLPVHGHKRDHRHNPTVHWCYDLPARATPGLQLADWLITSWNLHPSIPDWSPCKLQHWLLLHNRHHSQLHLPLRNCTVPELSYYHWKLRSDSHC